MQQFLDGPDPAASALLANVRFWPIPASHDRQLSVNSAGLRQLSVDRLRSLTIETYQPGSNQNLTFPLRPLHTKLTVSGVQLFPG